jgi:Tol biopolymer transport system component
MLLAALMMRAKESSAQVAEAAVSQGVFVIESVTELDPGTLASAPRWSPDGKWIAFSVPKGNGIGIIRPDGSERRVLTSEAGSGYKFAWSPDASRIVFRAARKEAGPRKYVIRVIEIATGEIESSSEVVSEAQPPVWQRGPAGMRWISYGKAGAIEGAWRNGATSDIRAAAIGPPLLIAQARGLWLHVADAALRPQLSDESALNPVWSSDGGRLAFDAADQIAVATPPAAGRKLCVGNHPAWSPDGQWIVFQITRDHSHASDDTRQHTPDMLPHLHDDKTNHRIVDSDLWIIGADGTRRHQLTNTPDVLEVDPDWSPDGTAIVCRTEETGRLLVLRIVRR